MKTLYINDELKGEAEKIVKTTTDIIGYNGTSEVFALRGFNFAVPHEVRENGNVVDFDPDPETEKEQRLADLEAAIAAILGGAM